MPSLESMNASPLLPTNISQQNELKTQENNSPKSSHNTYNANVDSHLGSLTDPPLTPFPSLTGLKSRSNVAELKSLTIGTKIAFAHLQNATASLDALPIAALQAAWAVILSTYTAAKDDVVYTSLIPFPACQTSHAPEEDAFYECRTRVCLRNPQRPCQETSDNILKHLTESNKLALCQSKQSVPRAARFEERSRNGTSVTLTSKNSRGDDNSVLKRNCIEGEELAVSIVAWPDDTDSLTLKVLYSDLVLNQTGALVMLEQLEDILMFVLENPEKSIADSLTAIRSPLLSILNETSQEFTDLVAQAPQLHAQFESTARYNPHRVALDFRKNIDPSKSSENITWTYEQLNDRAEIFAKHLINRFGQLTDDVVPICMIKCPELYVAVLGILKTGGAWCPIDPSFPPRRRHDLIARTGARILVVGGQDYVDSSNGIPQGVITVDIACLPQSVPERVTVSVIKRGSLAYLIWTSGTTGDPKGVPIHHKAAVTSMRALQESIPIDVTGGIVRCVQFSQFTFDVFIQDLFYTWGVGGTLISSTQEVMLGSFPELATQSNATHAHLTPAFAASVRRERCPTLEVVTMIGEKLPQSVADDWSQVMRAFNTYGPAETAVVSTFRQFGAPGDELQSENIGFPLPSVSAFVIHDNVPTMRQGIGELALGGSQLSHGYWNDLERSSERFIWNEQYSKHLYMTGDLVRQLYDGSLEFIGRTDDLIKIQGIRIELSEIGFSLRSCHPLIEQIETQYLNRQDRPSRVIVTFLATPTLDKTKGPISHLIENEESFSIAKIALLEAQKILPDYMIPNVFLVVNCIPRTSSAKTDSAVLKEIYRSVNLEVWEKALASNGVSREAAFWSTRESVVIAVIAEVSGTYRDSMSRASDLRSIGIDSIAATRLAPLLNAKGLSVSVFDMLQCQTLDDLLKMTNKSRTGYQVGRYDLDTYHNEWYPKVSKVIKRGDFVVAPALPLQESLLSESMQNASAYWSTVFLCLDAQVDIIRLHEAWSQVVSRTEALRTGFIPSAAVLDNRDNEHVSNSTFMQLLYREATLDWTYVNSSEMEMKNLAAQRAVEVAKSHQNKHFIDPLLTITILGQQSNRTMMISIHHSVRDEPSLDFILEDVCKYYKRLDSESENRHQLREALEVMLPTKTQVFQDEKYWSKALDGFGTHDDAKAWPDLTGKKTQSEEAAGLISHTQTLKIAYKDLHDAALHLGASSVASLLRVAWGSVLLEYLETDRVVFAETWSNRIDDFKLADIVGPLLTVLPVPFRATGSSREAFSAQSEFQNQSRAHRSVHPRFIRKLLGPSEHQPLYPALFNFLPRSRDGNRMDSSSMWNEIDGVVGLTVEHPLALNVVQAAAGVLEIEISGSRIVMSSPHLAILASQVEASLETMLRYPDIPIMLLSTYFPRNLLSVTSVSFSENVTHAWKQNPTDWVDHYAATHPHWPAVEVASALGYGECKTQSWNFAELRSAYSRVAALISRVDCFNCMIAVCLDRRIEAYAVILGILASGNTYLPIDEDLPRERKSFLLQDSTAEMLFTTSSLALTLSTTLPESHVIYVDDDEYIQQMVNENSLEKLPHPGASDNAYLLYTSGSTGVPKGVLVGRGNLCSFIEGLSEFICPLIPGMKELPGKGKYLGLASRAFDVHIAEMFLAWRLGLAAVTAPRTMLLDNLELALRELKITHASFVPSLIDQAGLDPANLPDLRYLGVGGEKMSKRVVDTWASNENAALVNAYGPTEMSIGCTAAAITTESNLRNVGRPYGNSVAHVLVPDSNRYTLRGVAGELCFTGDLVANGYHNRPDAKGFMNDFNGQRMYRTGDIVRMMADDTLEYLRREDDQTKVRGQRLELGEISEAIRSIAATTLGLKKIDVATMIAQHPKLSKPQLVNFYALIHPSNKVSVFLETSSSSSEYKSAIQIQAGCRKVLPAYMVPDVVIPLTKLPLAPSSGKADFKRLKALFADISLADMMNHTSSDDYLQPESTRRELTGAERNVRSVVTSTLSVNGVEISANTNIFRLGLDSLSAISLAIRLQRLGYDCTVSSVLRNPLVEQLALLPQKDPTKKATMDKQTQIQSKLAELESRFRASRSRSLGTPLVQAVKPCLPLQETLVATSLQDKSGTLYVNHLRLELSTDVDHGRLYRAWRRVVADHDILRTCFQEFENGILQVILKNDESKSIAWAETVVSDPESASRLQQNTFATDIISSIASKVPMRLTLFRPSSDGACSILLFSIHHALYDGESMAMILHEFKLQYHSADPPDHTSFDSMIEYIYSQDQEKSKTFWRDYLTDYQPTQLLDRAAIQEVKINVNRFPTVDRILTIPLVELEDFSSSISGTLTSTIQAVFGIILAQTLKTQDVVFGVVLSGRTVPIENPHTIVAPCITTIPQRVNLNTEYSVIVDLIKEARKGFVASLEFQHTALRDIHRWLGAEKALFDCLVSYIDKKESKSNSYSDLWTELEGSMPDEFPLSVEFEADHESGRMQAHCAFSPAFGDLDRAALLLENVDLLLGALVRRENVTIGDLGISRSNVVQSRPKQQLWDESNWTPRELEMRQLAAEICGISAEDISKGASFFSLGIDSITAIRFARRLRQSGMECSSVDVMRYSCIGALARKIDTLSPHVNDIENIADQPQEDDLNYIIPTIPILSPRDLVTDIYVCTPLQSSMLTQTLASDGALYSHHHAFRIARHIDLDKLKHSWALLTVETEILRTTFHYSNAVNLWLAAVHQENLVAWSEQDVEVSLSESLSDIIKCIMIHEEVDFERSPWKINILKTATEIVLVLSMHHSLYDGESISLLFQDLARLYEGNDLPQRPPFSDAARAISKRNTDAEKFWLQKLDGFHGDGVCHSEKATNTGMIDIEIILKMNIESVLRSCKDLGVTTQTVALLAYAKSLACYCGCRDVVFGHVVGGRSLAMLGADEIVGPLFNTVPSRIIFDKTYVTNENAAIEIQRSSGDSQQYQHAPLGRIQQSWRQRFGDSEAQLFDTLFVFQNSVNRLTSTEEMWTAVTIDEVAVPTEYPLNFEFEQRNERIVLRIASRKGLITQEQLRSWLTNFEQAFQDILEHPMRSVMAFPSSLQSLPLAKEKRKSHQLPQDDIKPGPDLETIRSALSKLSGFPPENIPLDASIFSLGLDSISAIEIAATCRKQGFGVSVADVLQGRSLGGICRGFRGKNLEHSSHIETQKTFVSAESKSKALRLANVKDEDIEDVLPCLAGQIYHLASWLKSRRTMCEAIWTYHFTKRLNVDHLESAWRDLRKRHPVLRTIFVSLSPKEAVQLILKDSILTDDSFECTEAQGGPEDKLSVQIKLKVKQPFDLFTPPSKLCLIRGETRDFVILKLHHATYDAWTISTIIKDLAALYLGIDLSPPPPIDSFIQHTIHALNTSSEKAYWLKSLQSSQPTLLRPSTHLFSPNQTSAPIALTIKSALPDLHTLETLCRQASTTLPTLILLAHARNLSHYTAIASPTFGLYQTGRSAPITGIHELCYPCLNVTPVLIRDALTRSAVESAHSLQADLAKRVEYEQSYLHEVLEWIRPEGDQGIVQPLFNTYVNILSYERPKEDPPPSSSAAASSEPFFLPCNLDDIIPNNTTTTTIINSSPSETVQTPTAIDSLSVDYLAQHNLYLDVVRNPETDSVDFFIRCDAELMDEETVRGFAGKMVQEVQKIIAEIKGLEKESGNGE